METTTDMVEGMQFDRGYLSPYFVTDAGAHGVRARRALHPDPREEDQQHEGPAAHCSSRSPGRGQPLLIIAEEVEGEALATLVVNKLRGTLNACAVKAPGFGDRRKAMLEDIAILTGGKAIMEETGIKLEGVQSGRPGPRQARHDRQGQHHHHRGRGQREGHRRPHQAAPHADRRDHLRLRPRETAGAAGEAGRRRGGDQGRRGHRDRDEGEEGPRGGCAARHSRGGRGRHRARAAAWLCCAAARPWKP